MNGRSTSTTEICYKARLLRRICLGMGDVEENYVRVGPHSFPNPDFDPSTLQQPSDSASQRSQSRSSATTFHTAATSPRTGALGNNVDNDRTMRCDERVYRDKLGKPDRSSGVESSRTTRGSGSHEHRPPHIFPAPGPQLDSPGLADNVPLGNDGHQAFDSNDMQEALDRSLRENKMTECGTTGQDQKITALELELKIVKQQLQLERERRETDRQRFELEGETIRNMPLRAGQRGPEIAKVLDPDINYAAPRGRELWIGEIRRVNGRNTGRERRLEVGEYVVCRRKKS
ncbi:hypothetical protein LTR43_008357 [Exophiala xenobiotica]|nr:hypothetical protein LTR93_008971 [Exophiala xenobiotica]KAK5497431.1 hypothetical protein LTR55_001923 [Exophiala xenobiotica]